MNANTNRNLRIKQLFVATVLIAAVVEGTAVLAQQRPVHAGRDAFLPYQVNSTDALIATLQKNPTLRKRYAKHFGLPEDRVVDFIKNSLITYNLPEARDVTTYGVTKSGRIYPVKQHLRKGTKVWATRSGLPVLKWACANPLTKNLPVAMLPSRPHTVAHQGGRIAPPVVANNNALTPVDMPLPTLDATVPALDAPAGVAASDLLPVTPATSPVLPVAATVPAFAVPAGGSGNHFSALLPLLPLAFLPHHGGGGGGTTTTTIPIASPTPPPFVAPTPGPTPGQVLPTPPPQQVTPPKSSNDNIPEPGTLALFAAMGLPAFAFVARRAGKTRE